MMINRKSQSRYYLISFLSLFIFFLNSCSSDESNKSLETSDKKKSIPQVVLSSPSSQFLYETAIEIFTIGISSDDPAAVMQGISLLEQATIASPDETTYWVDLADAYMASEIALQYPYAIDIYWMLYNEDNPQNNVLLTRLIEAYTKVDNYNAAFEVATIRLSQADDKQVDNAALHLTMLAMSNSMFDKAAKALIEKAEKVDTSAYLLLLASTLKEATGDIESSVKMLDDILGDSKNTIFFELISQAKQRMKQ